MEKLRKLRKNCLVDICGICVGRMLFFTIDIACMNTSYLLWVNLNFCQNQSENVIVQLPPLSLQSCSSTVRSQ